MPDNAQVVTICGEPSFCAFEAKGSWKAVLQILFSMPGKELRVSEVIVVLNVSLFQMSNQPRSPLLTSLLTPVSYNQMSIFNSAV